MELILHRGISVEPQKAAEIIDNIKNNGISGSEGNMWKFTIADILDVRKRIEDIFSKEQPTRGDVCNQFPHKGICACGDEIGPRFYALKHNRDKEKRAGIIISFKANLDDVYVDCRDFLCPAFQFWDRVSDRWKNQQTAILSDLFGPAVLRYFERCVSSSDQQVRIAMCNLASYDVIVIKSHYENRNVIGGRYGVRFCSAFFVKAPTPASSIISCNIVEGEFDEPELYTDMWKFQKCS